jgi:hypothetical protein
MPPLVRRWLPVLLWILVIYTTIPFVRVLREWYVARWDPVWIGRTVAAVLVAAAVSTLVVLGRRMGRLPNRTIAWVAGITTVSVLWTVSLRRSPEETVHFLEYGVLAILLHRALRPSIRDVLVFAAGALIGSLVGTVDEMIQWLSPGRYWDWRDLALNGGAGVLTQLVIWRIVPRSRRSIDPASVRFVLRLAAAQLALLTVCLANTPARVARYAPYLPGGEHLTSSLNPMAEYGHRHVVPGFGVFNSRLTLEALQQEDATRPVEVAGLLDENRHSYGHFLDTWPVDLDPFTYEARVHLFARDRNLAKARAQDFRGSTAVEQLTVAWHENRLMEVMFGNTLNASSYRWKSTLRQRVEDAHDPVPPFRSAAGSHLITIASEGTIRVLLTVLVAGLFFADHRLGRSTGRR